MFWIILITLIVTLVFFFGGGYVIKMVESDDPKIQEKLNRFRQKHDKKVDIAFKVWNWGLVAILLYMVLAGTYYE